MLTSWLALVSGVPPEMRAGCSGRILGPELFPAGMDFAVNVPADLHFPPLLELMHGLRAGDAPALVDPSGLMPARTVHAPLLTGCNLQIECAQGRWLSAAWEPELCGEILLLHRGGLFLDPAGHDDFCALWPLRAVLFS